MTQYYSDPSRENDPHALPDVEVFYCKDQYVYDGLRESGWYYWFCFPGCLPDSDPLGPFKTEKDAVMDMYEHYSTEWTGER
jgi:hypothetical protein